MSDVPLLPPPPLSNQMQDMENHLSGPSFQNVASYRHELYRLFIKTSYRTRRDGPERDLLSIYVQGIGGELHRPPGQNVSFIHAFVPKTFTEHLLYNKH